MEEKKCKKCQRKLPMNYKYARCEHCRGKSAENVKKVGAGVLGGAVFIVTAVLAIGSFIANKDDGKA